MGRIITKNSSTVGVTPSGLVKGELAINTADGKLYYGDGSTTKLLVTSGSGGGGGGTGTVTSVQLANGTGISLSGTNPITTAGTITITNRAPDQTVVLNDGTGINVTGTYPNFTINNTVNSSTFLTTSSFNSWTGSSSSQFAGTASYATTASYALNAGGTPGGLNTQIQFNANNAFSGSPNFTFDSGSNTLTLTGSLKITGSTTQIGNNNLYGNTSLSGSIVISGSTTTPSVQIYGNTTHNGYIRFDPVTTNIDQSLSASYIYVSGSTNDLYFTQNGNGYNNTTRLRWLEGNLYTGLLYGGLISASVGGTTFNVSSGSGIIVTLNASVTQEPYPTVRYVTWGNFTGQTINNISTAIQTYIGIDSNGAIIQQTTPWLDGQYNESISLGTVIHQNLSTVNATITYPNVAYGYKQRTYDFIKAFGPLKLSGYELSTSSSLGLTVGSGSAFADGRNYQTDPNNPSYINDNGTAVSKIFRYYQSGSSFVQDTNGGAGYTGIDTTQYNLNGSGSLVSTSGGKYYAQRVFWYPNSATKGIVVYYGLAEYNSLDEAQADYAEENFLETPNTQQNAIYLGVILIRGNGSFSTPADYRILKSSLFRAAGTGGGGGTGGGATTLGALTDVQLGTLTDKQSLVYDIGSSKWVNTYALSGSLQGTASWATNALTASTVLGMGSYNVTQSFSNSSTWTFNHNLGYKQVIVQAYDSSDAQIVPQNIVLTNANTATITFPTNETGYAVATVGGTLALATSSFAQNAVTASYYVETDPIFTAKSASLATTGSNTFTGGQVAKVGTTSGFTHATTDYGAGVGTILYTTLGAATGNTYGAINVRNAGGTSALNDLILNPNGTGKVAIGNSKTSANATLDVNGSAIISGSLTLSSGSVTLTTGSITITTGSIVMPNRPAFRVYGAGTVNNLSTTTNGDGTLNSNNFATDYTQGTGFDASTGIFTAPIAGLYHVDMICRNDGNANYSQLIAFKNNSIVIACIEFAGNSTMNHVGASSIAKLAVGDTLRIKVAANTITFDGNDSWAVAYIG